MEDIRKYAKIGLVYHLLYPQCVADPDYHINTLEQFVQRTDIETLDCCIPFGDERRQRAGRALTECEKEVVCAAHLFPFGKLSPATGNPQEQAIVRLVMEDQIQTAAAAGAVGFIIASGSDVLEEQRPDAREAFADFCVWFCKRAKQYNMTIMLEPMDRTFDKRFLYGPTEECAQLVESLAHQVDNFGIELDVAHLPLMGESFRDAFRTVAPYLKRVHLGNCVTSDPASPWYGDKHPPIGIEGGEIDVAQLADVLRAALEIGYIGKDNRGALVFEIQPFPGRSVEQTVRDNMDRLERAWSIVSSTL